MISGKCYDTVYFHIIYTLLFKVVIDQEEFNTQFYKEIISVRVFEIYMCALKCFAIYYLDCFIKSASGYKFLLF